MNPEIFKEILDELQLINLNLSEIAGNISSLSDEISDLNSSLSNKAKLHMGNNNNTNSKNKKK
ncbi:MAG: hypothetical protein ACE5RH_00590 [Nitrosarchaeum sp.]